MPPTESLVAFLLATLLLAVTPGPGMVHAAAETAASGRAGGRRAAIGYLAGGLVHLAAATLGAGALVAAWPAAAEALRLIGAAWLAWTGLRRLRGRDDAPGRAAPRPSRPSPGFRDAFAVEALNPTSLLFFLAFLPPFADPAAGLPVAVQILVLGLVANLVFSLGDLVAVEFAHRILRAAGAGTRAMRHLGGLAMVALAAAIALDRPA